jgi:uncharacterized membrane protein YtjA (UPF0391 family)
LPVGCRFHRELRRGSGLILKLRVAEDHMNFGNLLHWAVVFLIVAVIAAVLGFGGVAGTAMEGARILFWVALVLLLISLVFGFARRGRY